ncbi:hypothetical protein BC828DRAFT_422163 [Blastocladiella britannica]|nr:hypothetical protein BC828DRAFT_422163 [Blastocladiella britannica]
MFRTYICSLHTLSYLAIYKKKNVNRPNENSEAHARAVDAEFTSVWSTLAPLAPSVFLAHALAGHILPPSHFAIHGDAETPTPRSSGFPLLTSDLMATPATAVAVNEREGATSNGRPPAPRDWMHVRTAIGSVAWPSPELKDRVLALSTAEDPRLGMVFDAVWPWSESAFLRGVLRLVENDQRDDTVARTNAS